MKKRCIPCNGSGRVMGGGMMLSDCEHCDGKGKIDEPENELEFLLTKDSKRYQEAKEKIKKLDPVMSDTAAEQILDEELNRVNARG